MSVLSDLITAKGVTGKNTEQRAAKPEIKGLRKIRYLSPRKPSSPAGKSLNGKKNEK
jgi:hypothetical protein